MAERRWFELWKPRVPTDPNAIAVSDLIRAARDAGVAIQLANGTKPGETPRPQTPTDGRGFGSSGTPLTGLILQPDDYNRDLQGKNALRIYERMRRSDAQVRATLQMITLPILGALWEVVPPDQGDSTDQQIADFVKSALVDDDAMMDTWDYTVRHMLMKLPFGFSVLEKIWMIGPTGELRFRSLSPRLPLSIEEWHVDDTGALVEIIQRAAREGREQQLIIPGEYVAVIVQDKEGDNYNGLSLLRSAYKHWKIKDQLYNIDAISHERWGVGIPVAGETERGILNQNSEKNAVIAVLENMRAHQQSYAIEPYGVKYRVMTPEGTKGNDDIIRSIEHHDVMIARNILAPFINVGQSAHGTRSSTEELTDVFFNAVESVARSLCSDSKRQLIKPLCDLNFDMSARQYPSLRVSNVRKTDPVKLAETMERLLKAGGLTYDEGIENMIRALLGFGPVDPAIAFARRQAQEAGFANVPPGGAGDATENDDDGQDVEPRQLSSGRAGGRRTRQTRRRNPTDFETVVLSLNDIPRVLDRATDGLVRSLTDVRERQVRWLVSMVAAMTAANPGKPFTGLDPAYLTMPGEAEIERIIRDHQAAVALYGAEQVRLELKRQGANIDLKHSASERVAFTLAATEIELADTTATAVTKKTSVRALLDASARTTSSRLNASLIASVVEEAQRFRRAGLVGAALERALIGALAQAAGTNVSGPARAEINEAFGLGRANEAAQHRAIVDRVIQSALLDRTTCAECEAVDGREMVYGSPEQVRLTPPYVNCQGRENCRCVQLLIIKDRR